MRAPTVRVLTKVAARSRRCNPQRWRGAGRTQTPGCGHCSHSRVVGGGVVISDMCSQAMSGLITYYLQGRSEVRGSQKREVRLQKVRTFVLHFCNLTSYLCNANQSTAVPCRA